ncbi:DUF2852 domain-containing protein [Alsobacter sp. KACC 23698]
MIAGFVFFWPAGLAILAWKGWKEGWCFAGCRSQDAERGDRVGAQWGGFGGGGQGPGPGWPRRELRRDSGNSAFEDYKQAEIARLQAEFDRLVEEQRAFGEHLESLRRAKDKEEFDSFLASRRGPQGAAPQGAPGQPQA